jgi:hypothetical protein
MDKTPKDLGLKLGTKKGVFWTKVKLNTERDIENANNLIELSNELIKVADRRIKEEEIVPEKK